MTRYGHVKAQRIGLAATPSARRGAGMSRMRVVSLGGSGWVPLIDPGPEAIAAGRTPPSGSGTSSGSGLEGDDPVMEGPSRRLVRDLVLEVGPQERLAERRRGRDRPHTRRTLLGGLGEQVGLVLGFVLLERSKGHEHPGGDHLGLGGSLDDLGIAEHAFEVADPGLHQRLLVLGGVVLGILPDVAVLASRLQAFGDGGAAR